MSYLEPGKSEVQQAMLNIVTTLERKAKELREYAEGFAQCSDEEFEHMLGDQHAGPGTFRQWSKQVDEAMHFRPSEGTEFERTLTEVFARCQRERATEKAEERAAMNAAEEAMRGGQA